MSTTKPGKTDENLKDKIKNLFRRKTETSNVYKGPSKDFTAVLTPDILKVVW